MQVSRISLDLPQEIKSRLWSLAESLLEEFEHDHGSDHFFCVLDARENSKKVYRRRFCFHPQERDWREEEQSFLGDLLSHIEEMHPNIKGLYEAIELCICTKNKTILEIFVAKEETIKFSFS